MWREEEGADVFEVEDGENAVLVFRILESGLECLHGADFLAEDPYAPPRMAPMPTGFGAP